MLSREIEVQTPSSNSVQILAAGIAHEVRNPLTAVKGFLKLLKEEMNHPYLITIEQELDKALSTLTNLLHVTKPDFHDEPSVPINLCQELDSVAYLFQEKLYQIQIVKDYQNPEVMVVGKRNGLIKALFNLMKNAIEAIDHDGNIVIEQYIMDGSFNLKITDTGIGIPEEKLTMLGTPFFSTKSNGTGMGLTQVFTIIHNHNGRISVKSEVGKGTTFHILLPI
ncbi:MAG TPA: ATP-binding protein [Pseudoneobacillus sp.]|nr:ATP-binding protein [Pseudoneobacillus sp.]